MLAVATRFLRQIVPPVIATLIAAVLIASYNKTFSGHLSQPRMGGLDVQASAVPAAPASTVAMTRPPVAPVTEVITIHETIDEHMDEPERLADKDAGAEAAKDQTVKLAAEPAPQRTASVAPKPEPRAEPRRAAEPVPVIVAAPAVVTAPPAVATPVPQQPAVVMAAPIAGPMVTVPDRPNARPAHEVQPEEPVAPPQGVIGTIVNTLKPSSLFARAREFGEKIEQTGNDILPNIRQ